MDLVAEDETRVGAIYFLMSEDEVRRKVALPYMSFGSDGAAVSAEGVFLKSGAHPRALRQFRARARPLRARREAHDARGRDPSHDRAAGRGPQPARPRHASRPATSPTSSCSIRRRSRTTPPTPEPHQYATGVSHVIVNGELALADGEPTDARPGRFVRGRAWNGGRERRLPRGRRGLGLAEGRVDLPVEFLIFGVTLARRRRAASACAADRGGRTRRRDRLRMAVHASFPRGPGAAGPRRALRARVGDAREPAAAAARLRAARARTSRRAACRRCCRATCRTTGKARFALLVIVFVMSGFLDNIAAALIGGAMAHTLFRGRVRVGYLAAIVAASNAGGAGSVIGDTTTTMMWIKGVSPFARVARLHRRGRRVAGLRLRRRRAQQQRFAPIIRDRRRQACHRLAAGRDHGFVLACAVAVNVGVNLRLARTRRSVSRSSARRSRSRCSSRCRCAGPTGGPARRAQGLAVPAVPGRARVADAGGVAAGSVVEDGARARLRLGGLRQHPADGDGA